MPLLYAVTLFVSAALLFVVQPMIGRLVLPLLGGTPAVWNTCMVFFQAALLAGYAYAHALPRWLGVRRHALLHALVLLLPLLVLPLGIPAFWPAPSEAAPVPWLLGLLFASVGLPFVVLATTAPLLQRWLAASSHASGRDPYYLYAASNLGSLLALVSYPFLIEPQLSLADQRSWWSVGYALWAGLCLIGTAFGARAARPEKAITNNEEPESPPDRRRVGRWVLLGFVPSGLLLSVSTYLTTDIAAVPLLWVAPLALYLVTFILSFARYRVVSGRILARGMPLVVVMVVVMLLTESTDPIVVVLALHLLGLFWISLFCHTRLAEDRPAPRYLTGFYLWLSLGGVLGGLFVGLLAPVLFSAYVEYPLLLVLACSLRVRNNEDVKAWRRDLTFAVGLAAVTLALVLAVPHTDIVEGKYALGVMFGIPAVVCYTTLERPLRFALGLGALFLAGIAHEGAHGRTVARKRSFFGVHRVTIDPTGSFRQMVHGNTIHGIQNLDPSRSREPLMYYHPSGPCGRFMEAMKDDPRMRRVGLIGLGAGALTCFAEKGQHWTYFEIDPAVIELANKHFTFLEECPARVDIMEGDARLSLAASDERFSMIVIDAFSSDAIPVHLLTREAFALYQERLEEDGLILMNLSNRYLDLRPVLAALCDDAGLTCLFREELNMTEAEKKEGKAASQWAVMGKPSATHPQLFGGGKLWQQLQRGPDDPVWTDDYSNLVRVLRWLGARD